MDAGARIVLASASPRRRDLLAEAGLDFEVAPVPVDEDLGAFDSPQAAALALAEAKAHAAAAGRAERGERSLVIGADTVVAVLEPSSGRWRLLGKAEDEREAEAMLRALSGTRHQVITGVCVVRTPDLARRRAFERTWVTMRAWTEPELAAYVSSGEWRDKAGAYAIQESADRFVTALEEGGFDNVVGLPVSLTTRLLRELSRPS